MKMMVIAMSENRDGSTEVKARHSGPKAQDYWHGRGYYCIRARKVSRLR